MQHRPLKVVATYRFLLATIITLSRSKKNKNKPEDQNGAASHVITNRINHSWMGTDHNNKFSSDSWRRKMRSRRIVVVMSGGYQGAYGKRVSFSSLPQILPSTECFSYQETFLAVRHQQCKASGETTSTTKYNTHRRHAIRCPSIQVEYI